MKRIVILGAGESGAGAAVLAKVKGLETFVSDMSVSKDKYKELLDSHHIAWEWLCHRLRKWFDCRNIRSFWLFYGWFGLRRSAGG